MTALLLATLGCETDAAPAPAAVTPLCDAQDVAPLTSLAADCEALRPTLRFDASSQTAVNIHSAGEAAALCAAGGNIEVGRLTLEDPSDGDPVRDVSGLSCVVAVDGLYIERARDLRSLAGLDHLRRINSNFSVTMAPHLATIDLPALEYIGNDLTLDTETAISMPALRGVCRSISAPAAATDPDFSALELVGGGLSLVDTQSVSLRGFSRLKAVGGVFDLHGSPSLVDLSGLDALERVGGLYAWDMPKLESLAGAPKLRLATSLYLLDDPALTSVAGTCVQTVSADLVVQDNPALESLAGLDTLLAVGGRLSLSGLPLDSLDGLGSLRHVGSDLSLDNLPDLGSLAGLGALTSVDGDLSLTSLPALRSLDGLDSLTSVGGSLSLRSFPAPNLDGLRGVESVGGDVSIYRLSGLTDLAGLSSRTTLGGGLDVEDNPQLLSLRGLEGVSGPLNGNLLIYDNPLLVDLDALSGITAVVGRLGIGGSPELTRLAGLANVTHSRELWAYGLGIEDFSGVEQLSEVRGDLFLYSLPSLRSYDGFQALSGIDGRLDLEGSAATDLSGFSGLNHANGVYIEDQQITDLRGLEHLSQVAGDIVLSDNPNLLATAGLDALDRVTGGGLWIQRNPLLADVSGFEHIQGLDGGLTVTDNTCLNPVEAEALRDAIPSIEGTITLSGNTGPCP